MSPGATLDLTFAAVAGRTALTRRRYRWPLLIGRVFPDAGRPGVGSVTIQNAAGTVIPGDTVTQRITVVDGGFAEVRGQGAAMVTGIPGGRVAVEETTLTVDGTSRLVFDAAPRILTPHAHYRQRTQVCVAAAGRAVLVDSVVLHPELTDATFGSYESTVVISSTAGALLACDAQVLESMPRARNAPKAFASVYIVGGALDTAMTALSSELEELSVLTGDRRVYVGVSDLPNQAGWAVRIAASDGGVLRASTSAAMGQVISLLGSQKGGGSLCSVR